MRLSPSSAICGSSLWPCSEHGIISPSGGPKTRRSDHGFMQSKPLSTITIEPTLSSDNLAYVRPCLSYILELHWGRLERLEGAGKSLGVEPIFVWRYRRAEDCGSCQPCLGPGDLLPPFVLPYE